jgi:glutamine amidotransferase
VNVQKLGIIDYEAGNIASVKNALVNAEVPHCLSFSVDELKQCCGILLPGVGAAPGAMRSLQQRGLISFLQNLKVPFLGICLGMQILFERSEEGPTDCLGIIPGNILQFDDRATRVPHMGWNQVDFSETAALGNGGNSHFYFAHSFYVPVGQYTQGTAESGVRFSAAICKENYYGVQFHPEKSGRSGLVLLREFWKLCSSYQQSI